MERAELAAMRQKVLRDVLEHIDNQEPLLVLKAPPGSGKTYVSLRAVALARHRGQSVAVATQTNNQADDFCRRMAADFPAIPVVRFASSAPPQGAGLGKSVTWVTASKDLPPGPKLAVATSAKWAASNGGQYDLLLIDEAWQLSWADFMILSKVAPRFALVGDPGQIAPVVTIDVSRWETSRRPPHWPAPNVIVRDGTLPKRELSLPVTTRLPYDTAKLIQPFYDFAFDSWAGIRDRQLSVSGAKPGKSKGVEGAIDLLTTGSVSMLTLPTPVSGPPLEEDVDVAAKTAEVVKRLLARKATVRIEEDTYQLKAEDIGVAATHRVMNTRIAEALGDLASRVRADTPERWQGLERKVMVIVHPMSGVTSPSPFDLDTGRLCVMASRHQVGLIMVSRDHVGETLEEYFPSAEQAVGLPDEAGEGHSRNWAVWQWLVEHQRIAAG